MLALAVAAAVLVATVLNVRTLLNKEAADASVRDVQRSIGWLGNDDGTVSREDIDRVASAIGLVEWRLTESRPDQGIDGSADELSVPVDIASIGTRLLTWRAPRFGDQVLSTFAPTRVPVILIAVAAVAALLVQLLRMTAALEAERSAARMAARRDALSGLGNRLAFDEALDALKAGPDAHLLLIDLDGFKHVNDAHGHMAGDEVLKSVGMRLRDMAGADHRAFRLGGDEFALLTGPGTGRARVLGIARDIKTSLSAPVSIEGPGESVTVGASVGIASFEGTGRDTARMVRQADLALYAAKQDREAKIRFAADAREHETLVGYRAA